MSHILILYGTGEGQTKKICNAMARELNAMGHLVTIVQGDHWHSPESADVYDAFIIGASIHADRHQLYMLEWITEHCETLNAKPSVFFSVCLSAKEEHGTPEYEQAAQYVLDVMTQTRWRPLLTASFAGAMPFTRMGLLKRYALWFLTWKSGERFDLGRDYEYTDWGEVKRFVHAFGRILNPTVVAPPESVFENKLADYDVSGWPEEPALDISN